MAGGAHEGTAAVLVRGAAAAPLRWHGGVQAAVDELEAQAAHVSRGGRGVLGAHVALPYSF